MDGLDFFKERADIVTGTVVAKLTDGVTLTNRSRVGRESPRLCCHVDGRLSRRAPSQRDQTANIYANQTELNFKFNTGAFHHNLVAGVEVTRETINRVCLQCDQQFRHVNPRRPHAAPGRNPSRSRTRIHRCNHWKRQRLRRNDRHGRRLCDGYDPPFEAVDRERRRPVRRFRARPGRRAWCDRQCGDEHQEQHSERQGRPLQLERRYRLQAHAHWRASMSPTRRHKARSAASSNSTGAQYNGLSPTLVNVPPQEARSIEVGTKWELFNKHLLATAALFQTDVDHARTNDPATGSRPASPFRPSKAFAGKYRVQGIELGVAGNITKDWSVYGGLVLLDTEVLKSSTAQDVGRRLANIPLGAVLSAVEISIDRAVGGCRRCDVRRRGLRGAPRGQCCKQPYGRLVAFRRFRGVQAHEQRRPEDLGAQSHQRTLLRCHIPGDRLPSPSWPPGRAGYLTVRVKY